MITNAGHKLIQNELNKMQEKNPTGRIYQPLLGFENKKRKETNELQALKDSIKKKHYPWPRSKDCALPSIQWLSDLWVEEYLEGMRKLQEDKMEMSGKITKVGDHFLVQAGCQQFIAHDYKEIGRLITKAIKEHFQQLEEIEED